MRDQQHLPDRQELVNTGDGSWKNALHDHLSKEPEHLNQT